MKKLLSLLMVLCCAIGASAQQGWTARTGQSQDRTVVIADFSVTNGASVYEGNWRIGVFVGDECRLVTSDNAQGVLTHMNNQQFLMLEVPGNFDAENDEGKEIVIKVSSSMGDVYTLKPDQTLTWQPETTYGVGSGPRVQLALTLPAEVTLSGFRIDAGNSVDLTNFLNVSPANAQIPENLIWYVGNNYYQPGDYGQFATISGSTLTAVKPNLSEGENLPIPYGFVINAGNYMPLIVNGNPVENASFYIEQPATTLTIVTETFEVERGFAEELTVFMHLVAVVKLSVKPQLILVGAIEGIHPGKEIEAALRACRRRLGLGERVVDLAREFNLAFFLLAGLGRVRLGRCLQGNEKNTEECDDSVFHFDHSEKGERRPLDSQLMVVNREECHIMLNDVLNFPA